MKTSFFQGPARRMLLMTLLVMTLRLPLQWLVGRIGGDPAMYYGGLILLQGLLWGLPAVLMRPWRSDALPENEKCGGLCAAALLLGVIAQLAMTPVTLWWADVTNAALSGVSMPENEVQWALAMLALCVMPALCEEAYFRGSVLTGLSMSAQKWSSLMVTTLLFALMHGSLAGLWGHLTVSLLGTLMMLRCGKLRVPVLLHLGYNAASMVTGYLPLTLWSSAPLGLLLLASAVWIAGGINWYSRRRMNLADMLLCLLALLGAGVMYLPELLGVSL